MHSHKYMIKAKTYYKFYVKQTEDEFCIEYINMIYGLLRIINTNEPFNKKLIILTVQIVMENQKGFLENG